VLPESLKSGLRRRYEKLGRRIGFVAAANAVE
jgi:hypothetical protein